MDLWEYLGKFFWKETNRRYFWNSVVCSAPVKAEAIVPAGDVSSATGEKVRVCSEFGGGG